ncbi:MAG: hypothetical protein GAK34_00316 [Delftia tsuruhatensis]|nr:MAG: hypothetical protein GAK34_00316 [Delftia tsuruhatensis]
MAVGAQCSLVRMSEAPPVLITILPRSRARLLTAMATAVLLLSTIRSTPSRSNQVRAWVAPTSALFWWSAQTTSIFLPSTWPPKSATAIFAASTEPRPAVSAYRPDMSLSTPMRTTSSDICCACAAAVHSRPAPSAQPAARTLVKPPRIKPFRISVSLSRGCFSGYRRQA